MASINTGICCVNGNPGSIVVFLKTRPKWHRENLAAKHCIGSTCNPPQNRCRHFMCELLREWVWTMCWQGRSPMIWLVNGSRWPNVPQTLSKQMWPGQNYWKLIYNIKLYISHALYLKRKKTRFITFVFLLQVYANIYMCKGNEFSSLFQKDILPDVWLTKYM